MCAPLYDNKGAVRYFIDAQVDVSGLIEAGRGLESFEKLLSEERLRDSTHFAEQHNEEVSEEAWRPEPNVLSGGECGSAKS